MKSILLAGDASACKPRHQRFAADSGRDRLTEEFDDRGQNVKRTDKTLMAVGDVAADYIEKTTLAGVAPCSEIRNGPIRPRRG